MSPFCGARPNTASVSHEQWVKYDLAHHGKMSGTLHPARLRNVTQPALLAQRMRKMELRAIKSLLQKKKKAKNCTLEKFYLQHSRDVLVVRSSRWSNLKVAVRIDLFLNGLPPAGCVKTSRLSLRAMA